MLSLWITYIYPSDDDVTIWPQIAGTVGAKSKEDSERSVLNKLFSDIKNLSDRNTELSSICNIKMW